MDRLHPWPENRWFWSLHEMPVLLLGASREDNYFQKYVAPGSLDAALTSLREAGVNYLRCTLSSRDEGDVWPYLRREDGQYDLTQLSEAFFARLSGFLQACHERDIVVQIELFDRFDHAREPWLSNPFNPDNNINYTAAVAAEHGIATDYPEHPQAIDHPLFRCVPTVEDQALLFPFVRAFVDRVCEVALPLDNVLFCIDNETHVRPAWGAFWAGFLHQRAAQRGVNVNVTQMWDDWDLAGHQHARTLNHPEIYDFLDVSQNNHQMGVEHWQNLQALRRRVADPDGARGGPCPLNCVKTYGADGGRYGTTAVGVQRFWLSLLGGAAASRFHRPPAGLGDSPRALREVSRARTILEAAPFHALTPRMAPESDGSFVATLNGRSAVRLRLTDDGVEVDA